MNFPLKRSASSLTSQFRLPEAGYPFACEQVSPLTLPASQNAASKVRLAASWARVGEAERRSSEASRAKARQFDLGMAAVHSARSGEVKNSCALACVGKRPISS